MVKEIWHKAASLQQTDDSIVFASGRAHWRHLAKQLNLCFLRPTSLESTTQTANRSVDHFCTSHRESPYTLSPRIAPSHGNDMKVTGQLARHENARHENARPEIIAGHGNDVFCFWYIYDEVFNTVHAWFSAQHTLGFFSQLQLVSRLSLLHPSINVSNLLTSAIRSGVHVKWSE